MALHLQHGLHLEEVGLAGRRQDPGHHAQQQELLEAPPLVALRLRTQRRESRIPGMHRAAITLGSTSLIALRLHMHKCRILSSSSHYMGFECGPFAFLRRM